MVKKVAYICVMNNAQNNTAMVTATDIIREGRAKTAKVYREFLATLEAKPVKTTADNINIQVTRDWLAEYNQWGSQFETTAAH
jgi:hypothetical protein